MRILHYILGFPPHRTGGLTKYALDLIDAETEAGHEVTTLYPGNFSFFFKTSKFHKEREGLYCLTNALPIPLMYGTGTPSLFNDKRTIDGFQEFIKEVNPDVFHVHTLMGLPKELLLSMKQSGVRIVYTSHDYFGLCPKVNFINNKGKVCEGSSVERCTQCCQGAPGILFLKFRNSKYLVPLKNLLR